MDGNVPLGDFAGRITIPEADVIWQTILADLQLQMPKATFEKLLLGSRALAWDMETNVWTIEVRYQYSPDWLRHRLSRIVERALSWRLVTEVPGISVWPVPQVDYVAASPVPGPLGTAQVSHASRCPETGQRHCPLDEGSNRPRPTSRQRPSPSPADSPSNGSARPRGVTSRDRDCSAQPGRTATVRIAGRRAGLTLGPNDYYLRLKIAFRTTALRLLKGSKLSVFLSVALHQDRDGISAPGLERIMRETGCCRTTVISALQALCAPELALLERLPPSRWGTSRYRVQGYASFGRRLAPALFEEEEIGFGP